MDVNTVQGTGQILPLVVGGAGFIRTIWLLIDEMLVKRLLGGMFIVLIYFFLSGC